jgi:hypothetical protein
MSQTLAICLSRSAAPVPLCPAEPAFSGVEDCIRMAQEAFTLGRVVCGPTQPIEPQSLLL